MEKNLQYWTVLQIYQHSFELFTMTLVNVIYVSYRLRVYSVKKILTLASLQIDKWKIGFVFRIITKILQTRQIFGKYAKTK